MKYSNHFINDVRPKRPYLNDEIIESILQNSLKIENQDNGWTKIWGFSDIHNKFIRIVMLEDGITIHTAFFDRSFKI